MANYPVSLTTFSEEQWTHYDQLCISFGDSLRASPLLKESIIMQQMQGPEGQAYNEGYPESTGYQTYQDDEQVGGSQPRYESQQKLQPERAAKLSTTSYVMAIMGVVASSLIMGLSIALVALTANIFGKVIGAGITNTLPYNLFGMIIGSFVVSIILLLISIAGYVFSIILITGLSKQRKRMSRATRSRPGY